MPQKNFNIHCGWSLLLIDGIACSGNAFRCNGSFDILFPPD